MSLPPTSDSIIDQPLVELDLFTPRLLNTLVRSGIVTLRLLTMHTRKLLLALNHMGDKGIRDIEEVLSHFGLSLATTASEEEVMLMRALSVAYYKHSLPYDLSSLTYETHRKGRGYRWTKTEIAEAVRRHPHIRETASGTFQFVYGSTIAASEKLSASDDLVLLEGERALESPTSLLQSATSTSIDTDLADTSPIPDLYQLWMSIVGGLEKRKLDVLLYRFGMHDNDPLTLEEVGDLLGITRERVRQLERNALDFVKRPTLKPARERLHTLLHRALEEANGVLSLASWEVWLDEHTLWSIEKPRPFFTRFLPTLFDDVSLLDRYSVLVAGTADNDDMDALNQQVRRLLKKADDGLEIQTISDAVATAIPKYLRGWNTPPFLAAVLLHFEHIGLNAKGRYVYTRRSKVSHFGSDDLDWLGTEGSRLQRWELRLRSEFDKVAWIGQLSLTEDDFQDLCDAVNTEAQAANMQTGEVEGNPRGIPAAVFVTSMVLSARYTEQALDESIDEFWSPYLRQVWRRPYTQAFMLRCAKRFRQVMPFLESQYGFAFPRHNTGDVVTPVFRHALIPRYMQTDFALWICKNWRHILEIAHTPDLLAVQLQTDRSLEHYYSHRLKQFIQGKNTAEAAAALTGNLAAAVSLFTHDEQSVESISDLLADRPIEQSLWNEIARQLIAPTDADIGTLRSTTPRLIWAWSVEQNEMVLQAQNLVISATSAIEGEPETLVWLEGLDSNPYKAEVDVSVSAWHLKTGERVITDVTLPCPNHGPNGVLVLLTDMDEAAITLQVPPVPQAPIQFFRRTQQGAYGVPVTTAQVTAGTWLVLSEQPLTFTDADEDRVEPDALLTVPYPLHPRYQYAGQITLTLPATLQMGGSAVRLTPPGRVAAVGLPTLRGKKAVRGLSLQVPPIFADTSIMLVVEDGGEHLLKQATLWLRGHRGGQQSWSLAGLQKQGYVVLEGNALRVNLQPLLAPTLDVYSLQLRLSLQPVFESSLAFAIVPGLEIDPPGTGLYTPAHPPQVLLRGVPVEWVVRRPGMVVTSEGDGAVRVVWEDLRQDPHLVLQAGALDIPLMWIVECVMVWLDPESSHAFLTLDEFRGATLRAIAHGTPLSRFQVEISGGGSRDYTLRRGQMQIPVARTPLYDAVRLGRQPRITLTARVGDQTWTLTEVRQRPTLQAPSVHYGTASGTLSFRTGLSQPWPGQVRFLAESLTNPFAPPVELATVIQLNPSHNFTVRLRDGVYRLRLDVDGVPHPVEEDAVRFVVGAAFSDEDVVRQLVDAVRSGHPIVPDLAEEFVLLWADLAEQGQAALTPSLRYQLATVPGLVLTRFAPVHLDTLWSPLVSVRQVQREAAAPTLHDFPPAWLFRDTPLLMKTVRYGRLLRVFPLAHSADARSGRGFAYWTLSREDTSGAVPVYVEWTPLSALEVRVQAGVPADVGSDWTQVEIEDTYGLYFCVRCGWVLGGRVTQLPQHITDQHRHGHATADVRAINYGDFHLAAELLEDRQGEPLRVVYDQYGVSLPYLQYLGEPPSIQGTVTPDSIAPVPLLALVRELKRSGLDQRLPTWIPMARLLAAAEAHQQVSTLGLLTLALCALLRSVHYAPNAYRRLLKSASLTEGEVQTWLSLWSEVAPEHLAWGLGWAERLWLYQLERERVV